MFCFSSPWSVYRRWHRFRVHLGYKQVITGPELWALRNLYSSKDFNSSTGQLLSVSALLSLWSLLTGVWTPWGLRQSLHCDMACNSALQMWALLAVSYDSGYALWNLRTWSLLLNLVTEPTLKGNWRELFCVLIGWCAYTAWKSHFT